MEICNYSAAHIGFPVDSPGKGPPRITTRLKIKKMDNRSPIPLPAALREPPPRISFRECVCRVSVLHRLQRRALSTRVPDTRSPPPLAEGQTTQARAPRWRHLVARGPNANGTPWAAQLAKDGAAMPGMSAWSGPISGEAWSVLVSQGPALSLSLSLGHFLKGNRLHPIPGQLDVPGFGEGRGRVH